MRSPRATCGRSTSTGLPLTVNGNAMSPFSLTVAPQAAPDDPAALAVSIKPLPDAEKDRLLLAVASGQAERSRTELLRRTDPPRRTVGELLDAAATLHE